MDLDDWRKKIDGLNAQMLKILNDRARCALAIAELKKRKMLPIHDPHRERRILESVLAENTGPLSDEAVRHIFECIMEEHRRLEEEA